ncbi:hypothetical protein Tco_0776357 [Tanacetum coccineum]
MEIPNFEQKSHEKYKKYNSSGSSSFNRTQYEEGGFNQNGEVGSTTRNKNAREDQRPMGKDMSKNKVAVSSTLSATGNGEALARLMVFEYATYTEWFLTMKKDDCATFLEIKRMEVGMQQRSEGWQLCFFVATVYSIGDAYVPKNSTYEMKLMVVSIIKGVMTLSGFGKAEMIGTLTWRPISVAAMAVMSSLFVALSV